jgi:hypothetical protein
VTYTPLRACRRIESARATKAAKPAKAEAMGPLGRPPALATLAALAAARFKLQKLAERAAIIVEEGVKIIPRESGSRASPRSKPCRRRPASIRRIKFRSPLHGRGPRAEAADGGSTVSSRWGTRRASAVVRRRSSAQASRATFVTRL